jgi:hypothetical protein
MTTRFDASREAAFKTDYATRTLTSVRFGLILGASLYGLFAPLDIWMLPETWPSAFSIRFGIVLPAFVAAFASTFVARARRHLQVIVSSFVMVVGLGIVGMIALSRERTPSRRYRTRAPSSYERPPGTILL